MARSVWKGPFVELSLLKKAEDAQDKGARAPIKTWSRRSTILPQFVGLTFNVDRKSTRLNSSHMSESRMPSSA